MIKLAAELFPSTGRDFDTKIKLNTSMAEKCFALQVVPKLHKTSALKQSWFTLQLFSLFSREQQAIVGSLRQIGELLPGGVLSLRHVSSGTVSLYYITV